MKYRAALILITTAIMSFPLVGCSWVSNRTQDKGTWSEKEVIETLYYKLSIKTHEMRDLSAEIDLITLNMAFTGALNAANIDTVKNDYSNRGEQVTIQIQNNYQTVYEGALKKLISYKGKSLWLVSIQDYEWLVNESENEIFGGNQKAVDFLNKITLITYSNSIFGYFIDYPPTWKINEGNFNPVMIYSTSSDSVYQYILVGVHNNTFPTFKTIAEYITYEIPELQKSYYQFVLVGSTDTEISYKYAKTQGSTQYEVNHYFIQHNFDLYEIICAAPVMQATQLANLPFNSLIFDASSRFRFQP